MRIPIELVALVGKPTLDRGAAYAREGRVELTESGIDDQFRPGKGADQSPTYMASGFAAGSHGNEYEVTVYFSYTTNGVLKSFTGVCYCPVARNCKHAVALYLEYLASLEELEGTRLPAAVSSESDAHATDLADQRLMRELTDIFGLDEEYKEFALAFEFVAPRRPDSANAHPFLAYGYGMQGLVNVIPMTKGKRGTWIKTGLTWHKVMTHNTFDIAPEARYILTDLAYLYDASSTSGFMGNAMDLRAFGGPTVWPLFASLRELGVPMLEVGTWKPVIFEPDPALAEIVIMESNTDASVSMSAHLYHPQLSPEVDSLTIGHPVHAVVWHSDAGIHIAQLEQPASEPWTRLNSSRRVFEVPARMRAAFEEKVLPQLDKSGWISPDNSFAPTPPPADHLHLTFGFRPRVGAQAGRPPHVLAHFSWLPDDTPAQLLASDFAALTRGDTPSDVLVSLQQVGQRQWAERLIPVTPSQRENFAKNASLLAQVGKVLSGFERAIDASAGAAAAAEHLVAQHLATSADGLFAADGPDWRAGRADDVKFPRQAFELRGLDAVRFAEQALPKLRELGVTVETVATVPEFREETSPTISLEAMPGEGGTRDWLDLNLTMRIGEHEIPMPTLLTALTHKEDTIFLISGEYVRLDTPELDRLRELLEEALQLTDRRRKGVRVPQVRVSWWEDLLTLGIVEKKAGSWLAALHQAITNPPAPAPIPAGLTAELRPYQREGFEWLARLRRSGLGGVLADDMGLGKTIQTLAMIQDERENPAGLELQLGSGPATDAGINPATDPTHETQRNPWLVVAPTSVVTNWAAEARKFTPGLKVAVVDTTTKKRGSSLAELARGADIVVTSYTLLRLDQQEYVDLNPVGLVLDEAQQAKNPAAKTFSTILEIQAPSVFAITGTPMENNLGELWAMFALTAPGLLGTAQQFRDKIQRPIEKGAVDTSGQFATLRRRIAPFLLRRTKELVASELPAKQEQIISVELAPAHRRLYDRQLQRERQRVLHLAEDIEHNQVEVLSALTRLRQMSIDPALVDSEAAAPSSKLDVLLPLLEEAAQEGHRTLVFSQFTTYLKMIAARLDAEGIAYSYLDGSTTNRAKVIGGFADGDDPVFLISLKAGGVGLNLTMADYVIICDPWWNPAVEAQAVDRTHRIGQTRSVLVYRLVSQDTIEEKVLALQDAKRALVSEVLLSDEPAASQPSDSAGSGVGGDGVADVARKTSRKVGGSRLTAEDLQMLLS